MNFFSNLKKKKKKLRWGVSIVEFGTHGLGKKILSFIPKNMVHCKTHPLHIIVIF